MYAYAYRVIYSDDGLPIAYGRYIDPVGNTGSRYTYAASDLIGNYYTISYAATVSHTITDNALDTTNNGQNLLRFHQR